MNVWYWTNVIFWWFFLTGKDPKFNPRYRQVKIIPRKQSMYNRDITEIKLHRLLPHPNPHLPQSPPTPPIQNTIGRVSTRGLGASTYLPDFTMYILPT